MFDMQPEDDHKPEDLLTRRANTTCLSEAELEQYLLDRLSGTTRESIEEHLLYCQACLDRVTEEEAFAASFRVAARRLEEENLHAAFSGPAPGRLARLWRWFRRPTGASLGLVVAGAVATLALVALPSLRQPPLDVSLTADRGLASALTSPVAAGRRLRLHLDATGLPESPLRLELAGPANQIIARSTALPAGGSLRWDLGRSLDKGYYWVRLYQTNPNTLLREFALTVK